MKELYVFMAYFFQLTLSHTNYKCPWKNHNGLLHSFFQVSMEEVENFRRNLNQIRFPENIFQFFAFRGGHQYFLNQPTNKDKTNVAKYATIRGIATKTIINVFTNKKSRKHSNKFILPMPTSDHKIFEEEEENASSNDIRPGTLLS